MTVKKEVWDYMQKHLGYTDSEMEKFKNRPGNQDIISKGQELMNKTIVFEVVKSKNCNSQHKVGDKFYFDGAGNLLTKLCPSRICIYALNAMTAMVFASNELIYAGADPNKMRLNRASCFDVGVECGGWGQIAFEFRMEDRKKK
jgi:uncharacterized repeat protein (TIGR04076 family)